MLKNTFFAALTLCGAFTPSFAVTSINQIYYHVKFPVAITNITESIDLTQNKYRDLILSNYVAGVLLGNMIHEKYPTWTLNHDYVYGSLFGQLLQENISTMNYDGSNWINNSTERAQLLAPGQGGPYQLNDYSKRLPSLDTPGSLGLINYTSLQGSLGYSINDQDSGKQTTQNGPASLDNLYFAPIAAAYFHFNDLNRLELINQPSWGPEADTWQNCKNNLANGKFSNLSLLLNAAYNAGTYSEILKTELYLCSSPSNNLNYVQSLMDYRLNDQDFINALQFSGAAQKYSLPQWYQGTTFILYPRQIMYYVDQLNNNNANLNQYGLSSNNSLSFNLAQLEAVFIQNMNTLGYVNSANQYEFISTQAAKAAFEQSMTNHHATLASTFNFNQAQDRTEFSAIISDALTTLEQQLHFSFIATTEVDHKT
ncbi:MAG: hypothetical protein KIT27_05295 [Legionellales bacterium]|nr:hypothetical protein [Legionellales bacterium]